MPKKERIDLTLVGPEEPLCLGIVDRFRKAKLRIFGPPAAAAKIEGDKAFSKRVMQQADVPTADAIQSTAVSADPDVALKILGQSEDFLVGGWDGLKT